jgi:hypothetical protein
MDEPDREDLPLRPESPLTQCQAMSLYLKWVPSFGAIMGSVSDLLGLRLSLPLQGQEEAVTACEKVSGTFSQEVARRKSPREPWRAPNNSSPEMET